MAIKTAFSGFSLIELIVVIMGVSVLAFAFIPLFTAVAKGGVTLQQEQAMENLAAGELDRVMSGKYSTGCPTSQYSVTLDATMLVSFTCSSITGGRHIEVYVSCSSSCASGLALVSLAGDAYDIW